MAISQIRSWSIRRVAVCAGTTLAAVLLVACNRSKETGSAPVVTVDVAPVLLSKIQQTIRAEGLLYPRTQAAIAPKVSAPIKKLHVQKGAKVRAGDLLLELENGDLAGAAAESRAALGLAQATFQTTSKATVPQEFQKAELDATAAKDALDGQQKIFDGRQALLKEGAIAQKDLNDARAGLSQARAQYETAKKHLDDLKAFGREQELEAAKAQLDAAKAHDDAAQAQFGYTRITSPIDGVITDLPFYAGETPQSGGPVVTVMDISQVVARAHVSPSEAAQLKVGSEANLIGPGGTPIPGKVTQISPALDATSSTVEVWVQAENQGGKLRPGSSLRVEMIAKTMNDALVIPVRAVLTSPSGSTFAMVIDSDNKPHLRKVAVGIRDSGSAEITDGLESGQRVATTGAFELFKLDPEVLSTVKVQIAPAKEEEEPEES